LRFATRRGRRQETRQSGRAAIRIPRQGWVCLDMLRRKSVDGAGRPEHVRRLTGRTRRFPPAGA
jgi:hypothetical protein